jgi:hypothetical protein
MQKNDQKVIRFQTKAKTGDSSKTRAKKAHKTGDAPNRKIPKMNSAKNDPQRPPKYGIPYAEMTSEAGKGRCSSDG